MASKKITDFIALTPTYALHPSPPAGLGRMPCWVGSLQPSTSVVPTTVFTRGGMSSIEYKCVRVIHTRKPRSGISKNYSATNSGTPVVELRFFPWLLFFKY